MDKGVNVRIQFNRNSRHKEEEMERIGDMLARALENQRKQAARATAARRNALPQAQSAPASSHASYTALMRSHDRVHTRHIAGKGSGDGA